MSAAIEVYDQHTGPRHAFHDRVWTRLCWVLDAPFELRVEGDEYVVITGGAEHRMPRSVTAARRYIDAHLAPQSDADRPYCRVEETISALTDEWQTTVAIASKLEISDAAAFERLRRAHKSGRIERGETENRAIRGKPAATWRRLQKGGAA